MNQSNNHTNGSIKNSSRVKSVDKVPNSGTNNAQTTKGAKQNYIVIPRSPEPMQNTKGGIADGSQETGFMKDQMNISTPLHYPSHQQKQQMRINSERIESVNAENKPMTVQGSNQFTGMVKQQMGLGQQQYTLNLDTQSKTQGYNFRAKKKSLDKQKFNVKSQEGNKPGQVNVSQSLNRASEQRHSINDTLISRQQNNNQYGDIMILPNIQQVQGQNHSIAHAQERPNAISSDNKKVIQNQNTASRHKQSSINRSQQVELGANLAQYKQSIQQRSINGNINGVMIAGPEGNSGNIYDNQQNQFIDANGNSQQISGSGTQNLISSHQFSGNVQNHQFTNQPTQTLINMNMDRGKSIGKMQTTGSRFKGHIGDGQDSGAGHNQYNLHLKDNLHSVTASQSPEYTIQEINKQKQAKISKYASNVDLKPSQGFNSHLAQVPMTTANSQIINDNQIDIANQNIMVRGGIQGHHQQNRSHVIASRQMGKRIAGQSLNGRSEINDLRIGQQQIMPTVKSNRDNSNNQQIKQANDLQRMQSRQRAQKQQFQTQNQSRDQSTHDIKVASVHNSFSAYRNGLQIKSEANWQSNRSQDKNNTSSGVNSGQNHHNSQSLRHQEQRKRARFHQQHYGGSGSNPGTIAISADQEQLILNNRSINDKNQSNGGSPSLGVITQNQIYTDKHQQIRADSLEAVNNSQEQQNIRNSRNNQRRIIMHSQGQINQFSNANNQIGQQSIQNQGQKNNFVSSTRNNNYKNDVNLYMDKLRQSGEGFNQHPDKKKASSLVGQNRRGDNQNQVRDANETPTGIQNNQNQSSKLKQHQNLTMEQLDVSEIKDKKKQNIHKTINIFDSGGKGQPQQKDIRVKYFNSGTQQQIQNQRRNNSRAESMDSNRSKSDNQQQQYNGKFLKQFQTQENRMYMQGQNTNKNQHRQSAGQILKPLKDASKIHSDHQQTKYNINPYTDNPNNQMIALDAEGQQSNPGPVEEQSKTPMVLRQGQLTEQQMQIPPQNSMPEKRNRSYTRGRKSGVRNQQISQTLQSSQQVVGNLEVQIGPDQQQNHQSPKINGALNRQGQHPQQQFLTQSYLKNKVQSQPDLPTIPLPLHGSQSVSNNQNDRSDTKNKNEQSGVVNPVKASPVPAVSNQQKAAELEENQRGNNFAKEVSPRKNTGITVGPGAAVGLGMPGLTQPYQLLKYSAISRCGMVLKQIMTTSGDQKNQQPKLQQILTPKINQDSFKVIKSFPEGTKPFNWLFGVFDGHGPHGEVMSQYAADAMPVILNNTFKKISVNFMPQIQSMQQEVLRLQQQKPQNVDKTTALQGGDQIQTHEIDEAAQVQQIQSEISSLNSKIRYLQHQRDEQIEICMKEAFDQVDTDMRLKFGQGPILQENIRQEKPFELYENDLVHLSGCTGTTILVQEDFFVVANCGDSPVYVFREEPITVSAQLQKKHGHLTGGHSKVEERFVGEQLSVNHKPDMPEEQDRIFKIGGVLDQFESQVTGKKVGPMRVWSKHTRQPGLAMSRSIGDNLAKSCGVIATPTVRMVPRNRLRDRAILVCSDGISDQISIAEMAETIQFFYKRQQDTENCCKQLVESATQKWHTKHNMQDDITCIVMFLR